MRIWSIHPKYLDSKGIVALWRETLLAKNVLKGNTKGYKNHPQLNRFKESENPIAAINYYLRFVYEEAVVRGYNFDKSKINWTLPEIKICVTEGQLAYERKHLLRKLENRDKLLFEQFKNLHKFDPHPMFEIISGEIESWEVIEK